MYQKSTPKQDKGGGINPPPRALACGLEDDAAGRHSPPRRFPSFVLRSLITSGKPAFLVYSTGYVENFSLAWGYYYDGYRAAI